MNKLEVRRGRRFVALLINGIIYATLFGLFINWYLYATKGKTIGSIVMKFKTLKRDGSVPGMDGSLMFWLASEIYGFVVIITLGTFFIYDMLTLEKRNGNYKEDLSEQYKTMEK